MRKKYYGFISLLAALTLLSAPLARTEESTDEDPRSLIGKSAPQVTLPLRGGGTLDLSKHAGKDYVVLDFWASWCPWCRKSTEHFVKVAQQFKDKNVAFYMVAVRDKEAAIDKYVNENKLDAKIALDPDRKMADPYLVDGIPHIVVIDPAGKILNVAVGEDKVGPAITETLEKAFAGGK